MNFKSFFTKDVTNAYSRSVETKPRAGRIIAAIAILIIGIPLFFASLPFGIVNAGQRGVVTRLGAVTGEIKGEGLYFRVPFVQHVTKLNVQTQKEEVDASAASKDLQTVNTKVALNYRLSPDQVAKLYQNVGEDFKSRLIDPYIQEAVKSVTAQFTAEELITKREDVREQIRTHLVEKFQGTGIETDSFSIINFDFSQSFNQAIEAKVTAEQDALAAKNKLAQVQYEAQQAVEEAKGKAEAIKIESAAINSNQQVLQLRAIEKWNGQLPQVTSGATPFINLK